MFCSAFADEGLGGVFVFAIPRLLLRGWIGMLTNIFYYNYYKPYIVKEKSNVKSVIRSKAKTEIAQSKTAKSGESTYEYSLNKAIKSDIVAYATDISSNLNSIKETTNFLINRYTRRDIISNNEKKNFEDGLERFVDEINNFDNFYDSTSKSSSALNGYKQILSDRLDEYKDKLSYVGIEKNEEGTLSFDKEAFKSIDNKDYIDHIFESAQMFKDIYDDTCEVMQLPMSEHMNFKNLDYYYSYTYIPKYKNDFKYIETGMLVDIKL